MATILLSAAGLAIGGTVGGSVLGLSSAVIGRAAGAAVGRMIDARLLGANSAPVETGRVDRFRLTGAGEGTALTRLWGRMRLPGHVIWSGPFVESVRTSGGGKASAPRPRTREHSYTVSLAIALCTGPITRVGRVWADGAEIARADLALSVYPGSEDQLPDPVIEAVEGAGTVPAFRGIAYVVIDSLDLGRFGNRVPQFTFEVFRPAAARDDATAEDLAHLVRAVAMIPGSGEYTLATTPVFIEKGFGETTAVNVHTAEGRADFSVATDALTEEMPACGAVSLVVSWFGNDLRAGQCTVRPRAEQTQTDAAAMPWVVSGAGRAAAGAVPQTPTGALYGGTPADASIRQAIADLKARGLKVMFYPFILMDQMAGNGLPDPWTGAADQPALPWRGRITLSTAPGRPGSPDGTAAATAQVAAFFGQAQPGHFTPSGQTVTYSGPQEWSLRRMILHYAHLCAAAGGVDSFCIGSELVGLTTIRDNAGFPAVAQMVQLAAEVKAILGPGCKVGYAADWTEYSGYQPPGTADKLFHLDPLWASPAVDFIGIDNYLPLSDWREGEDHADAAWGAIHNLDYLTANVAGGEYHDWYYHSDEARAAQIRTPITDGDGEPWVWRLKDLRGWWSNPHHNRVGGVRQPAATAWVPRSKPIWFTEMGCAAIDKGTNQPNKFLDPKSSESALPFFSNGRRDDLIQVQYVRAMHRHFADPVNNPHAPGYGGPMVDMSMAHVWAWDARPWPAFPERTDVWDDGANHARGHWLNGRTTGRPLDSVVADICADAGVTGIDTSRLFGIVRGYAAEDTETPRAMLQPLMLAHGFDAAERDGRLVFANRTGTGARGLDPGALARDPEGEGGLSLLRAPDPETAGRVRLSFVAAEGSYDIALAEAALPDTPGAAVTDSDLRMVLTRAEARATAERWLVEARVARDGARFALPPSETAVGPGDILRLDGSPALWRVDRIEDRLLRSVEAVRIEPAALIPAEVEDDAPPPRLPATATPVEALFMDLPLLSGAEVPHAPHVGVTARPWPGAVAMQVATADAGYAPLATFPLPATAGLTLTALGASRSGLWDRGPALRVQLVQGALASADPGEVLAGANLCAIGDGTSDLWEVFQFAEAELIAPRTWDLRLRLRGQAGTDGVMPQEWPPGSRFVLLDQAVVQIDLPPNLRDVVRHYRYGPALRGMDDPSWRMQQRAFRGIGLRPLSVAHLRLRAAGGDWQADWIRRTRIDGDSWIPSEVPLGEGREAYLIRVTVNGIRRREVEVTAPAWTYTAAMQAADGVAGTRVLSVAQLSDQFGPGPFRSVTLP